ncbi:MAG: hypothetical protein AUK49_14775 [Betaproteobacteria bacterium CG2_30_68_42]|nr:MAG: hypothetical protein AUK49_14775 [Betaproteobacteria bacterium CG2_30_68_42]
MVTVRGVNVFPAAVENLVRGFPEVVEFRVTVGLAREMDEMEVEVELAQGTDAGLAQRIGARLASALGFRPRVRCVEPNSLPRFELKAKRFHVRRGD